MRSLLLDVLPWTLSGSLRDQRLYVLALGCLLLGTGLCLLALRWARADVLAVAIGSGGVAAWLLSNKPAEGGVLVEVLPGNGITVSDVIAGPAIALVAVLTWRRLRWT